jgi:trigger factor
MQVSTKNLSETKVQLTLVADDKQLTAAKNETLRHLAGEMKLPGFRPGKAPLNLVEKNANPSVLQTEFLDRAMNLLYVSALQDQKLRPVAQPEVKISKFVPFDSLELEITVDIISEIKLPDYKKIKMAKPAVKITAKDVEEVIAQLKTREAEKQDVDRAAKTNDQVWIDFKGVDAETKEAITGADGKDYPLVLGSSTFIPGFEDNLIGMKTGEEKTFTLEFPKDYGVKSLQSKKVAFTTTVTKVQEVVEPKLDDEFAAKVGPFKTVDELKEDVKKQLANEKEYQNDRQFTDDLLLEITKQAEVSIPDSLIDEQIDRIVQEQQQNLMYRGQTWQEFLAAQEMDEAKYRDSVREDASLRVKAGLVLGEIADLEGVDVTPEEVEMRMQLLKGQYPDKQMQAEIDKPETRREIASRMVSEKTVEKLVSYATAK